MKHLGARLIIAGMLFASGAGAVQLDATFTPSTANTSASVELVLTAQLTGEEAERYSSMYVETKQIGVRIVRKDGTLICDVAGVEFQCAPDYNEIQHALRLSANTFRIWIPLSFWHPSALESGEYDVQVTVPELHGHIGDAMMNTDIPLEHPYSHEESLVVTANTNTAAADIDAMVQRFVELRKISGPPPEVFIERRRLINRLIYTTCPEAEAVQMRIFLGQLKITANEASECTRYILTERLIAKNDPTTTRQLVDWFLGHKTVTDWGAAYPRHLTLWVLHELHAKGNPEIVAMTLDIVDAYPKPTDPKPIPGLD